MSNDTSQQAVGMPGGLSAEMSADEEVRQLCQAVKNDAENKTGKNFDEFVPIAYKTQVVAGINYFVKVKIGQSDVDYLELRIYKPLGASAKPELSGVRDNLTASSEIEYF